MSIFSDNIVEVPWVGMAYEFWNCTNPEYKDFVWRDSFKINFSKTKLRDTLKDMLIRDGQMKLSEWDFDKMNSTLNTRSIYNLNDEYKFIILICLTVSTLNEDNLSRILTSCLKQTKLREGGDVRVRVRFPEKEFTYIIIHVHTFTPQRIEITLRRK